MVWWQHCRLSSDITVTDNSVAQHHCIWSLYKRTSPTNGLVATLQIVAQCPRTRGMRHGANPTNRLVALLHWLVCAMTAVFWSQIVSGWRRFGTKERDCNLWCQPQCSPSPRTRSQERYGQLSISSLAWEGRSPLWRHRKHCNAPPVPVSVVGTKQRLQKVPLDQLQWRILSFGLERIDRRKKITDPRRRYFVVYAGWVWCLVTSSKLEWCWADHTFVIARSYHWSAFRSQTERSNTHTKIRVTAVSY